MPERNWGRRSPLAEFAMPQQCAVGCKPAALTRFVTVPAVASLSARALAEEFALAAQMIAVERVRRRGRSWVWNAVTFDAAEQLGSAVKIGRRVGRGTTQVAGGLWARDLAAPRRGVEQTQRNRGTRRALESAAVGAT